MKVYLVLFLLLMLSSCRNDEIDKLKLQVEGQEKEIQELREQIEQFSNNSLHENTWNKGTNSTDKSEKSKLLSRILSPTEFVFAEIHMEMSVPHVVNSTVSYEKEDNFFLTNIVKVENLDADKENKIRDEARESVRLHRGMGAINSIKIEIKKFNSYSEASQARSNYNYTGPDVNIVESN